MSLEDFLFKKFYKFYTKEFHYEKLFIIQNFILTCSILSLYEYFNVFFHNKHLILKNKIPKLKLSITSPFLQNILLFSLYIF